MLHELYLLEKNYELGTWMSDTDLEEVGTLSHNQILLI